MEINKYIKISLSIFFLIFMIIMVIFIVKLTKDRSLEIQKSAELQTQIDSLSETINELQEKNNTVPDTDDYTPPVQENLSDVSAVKPSNESNITYTISVKDEAYAIIKATKNEKNISKEFEMDAMISDTGTMELPTIGTVALVATTGGEYYVVNIYQLVDDEIKLIGTIDCGADMVKETTYTVKVQNEATAIINAKINGKTIKQEFEMSGAINNTSVVDIFDLGKVVLIEETGGEYYGMQVYRLSQDYLTYDNNEIINVGSIQCYL